MTPLMITAKMSEPIVYYNDGMHFDGILAYGAYKNLSSKERDALPSIRNTWAEDMPLPLEKWSAPCLLIEGTDPRLTVDRQLSEDDSGFLRGNVWGWKASAAIPIGEFANGTHELRKKIETCRMQRYSQAKSHHLGSGPTRTKDMKFPSVFVRELRWFAHGDRDDVARLLRSVHAIGKLSKQGPGRVAHWIVNETDIDYSMETADGLPARCLPSLMYQDLPRRLAPIRAPYHHTSRLVWAVEPQRV